MNETLLNMYLLKEQFDKHFDDKYVLKYWFTKLLYSSSIMGIMDEYRNFGELAEVALENLFFENNKPFKDIYLSGAKQEGLQTEDIVMVATHDWDLFGAKKAGLTTAYIKRKEEIYHPFYLQADFNTSNLPDLIQQIINT
ncbi:Haloacid dehalogenase, type II [hydrothermal vent metagenome]|uniref:Haloacid dehalogenase, type II n=1 Tax=hydrothermal vent metagenome TaxID=652676 RepID=A0A3B0TWT0_9ZZZZ